VEFRKVVAVIDHRLVLIFPEKVDLFSKGAGFPS
jgi:hypothetical protein